MKKIIKTKMTLIQAGRCINRDDPGQEMSGVYCPGYCMATAIVFANTGVGINGMVCMV